MNGAMRGIIGPFFASLLLLHLVGCKSYWLGQYEGHIENGTRSIETDSRFPQKSTTLKQRAG